MIAATPSGKARKKAAVNAVATEPAPQISPAIAMLFGSLRGRAAAWGVAAGAWRCSVHCEPSHQRSPPGRSESGYQPAGVWAEPSMG